MFCIQQFNILQTIPTDEILTSHCARKNGIEMLTN